MNATYKKPGRWLVLVDYEGTKEKFIVCATNTLADAMRWIDARLGDRDHDQVTYRWTP